MRPCRVIISMGKIKRVIAILLCILTVSLCFVCCSRREDTLPEYYKEHMLSKRQRISQINSENNITYSFYFITDLHWETNTQNSPKLMKYLLKECKFLGDTIVLGGDYILYDYPTKGEAKDNIVAALTAFRDLSGNVYALSGNHEKNTAYEMGDPELTESEISEILGSRKKGVCYFDTKDYDKKVNCLYLDTNTLLRDEAQKEWLREKLTSLTEEWTTLIFMHIYNNYTKAGEPAEIGENGKFMERFLTENREEIVCSIAGIFSGHIHRDFYETNTVGVNVITTMCDNVNDYKRWDNTYERECGTYTEQAFDVVQIDTENKKVFMTRIGCGNDREYSY